MPNPWNTHTTKVSLAEVMSEEYIAAEADALKKAEEEELQRILQEIAATEGETAEAACQSRSSSSTSREDDTSLDEQELAAIQAAFASWEPTDVTSSTSSTSAASPQPVLASPTPSPPQAVAMLDDEALARQLQASFEEEDARARRSTHGKVYLLTQSSAYLERERQRQIMSFSLKTEAAAEDDALQEQERAQTTEDLEDEDEARAIDAAFEDMERSGSSMVTKHDITLSAYRNASRIGKFCDAEVGDIEGTKLHPAAYNSLKAYFK